MSIIRVDNVLDPDECTSLIEFFDAHKDHATGKDFCGWPLIHWNYEGFDVERLSILRKSVTTAIAELKCRLDVQVPQHPEQMILTGTGIGSYHVAHADNCMRDHDGAWVPNHTPHRSYTCMQYLNDNFDGGDLRFPDRVVTMRPKAGRLIVFPSDRDHVHEVTPVVTGMRYSLAMWLTENPDHAIAILNTSP